LVGCARLRYTTFDNISTYDLRRLKRKGLILKTPHSHRYQLTPLGRRVAVLFTKTYGRVLAPGLILLDPKLPDHLKRRNPLATAWRHLDGALDELESRFRLNPGEQPATYTEFELCLHESQFERL